MRIVARLKTIEEITKLSQLGVDVFLADTEFSVKRLADFSFEDLRIISKKVHENGKMLYVLIDKMIHEPDIIELHNLMENLLEVKIDGIIVSDLTVYTVACHFALDRLVIYQPGTFNTNSFDLEYFNERRLKGITISKEITLEEIKNISQTNHDIEVSLIGHGYIDMFYSKRKLLKNYAIHKGLSAKQLRDNYNLTLEEEVRENQKYPILEDYAGTHIFRSKKLMSFDEFQDLEEILDDFIISRIFMDDEEFFDSIKAYKDVNVHKEFIDKYGKEYDSGYYYKYTEKLKGELDES
jgi:U32 family peptidase